MLLRSLQILASLACGILTVAWYSSSGIPRNSPTVCVSFILKREFVSRVLIFMTANFEQEISKFLEGPSRVARNEFQVSSPLLFCKEIKSNSFTQTKLSQSPTTSPARKPSLYYDTSKSQKIRKETEGKRFKKLKENAEYI